MSAEEHVGGFAAAFQAGLPTRPAPQSATWQRLVDLPPETTCATHQSCSLMASRSSAWNRVRVAAVARRRSPRQSPARMSAARAASSAFSRTRTISRARSSLAERDKHPRGGHQHRLERIEARRRVRPRRRPPCDDRPRTSSSGTAQSASDRDCSRYFVCSSRAIPSFSAPHQPKMLPAVVDSRNRPHPSWLVRTRAGSPPSGSHRRRAPSGSWPCDKRDSASVSPAHSSERSLLERGLRFVGRGREVAGYIE